MTCDGGSAFALTDHACRHCGGRVLQAGDQFRCSTCGAVGMASPAAICGCGAVPGLKGGGFRCAVNTAKSDANPAQIIISWSPAPARIRRTVEAVRAAA